MEPTDADTPSRPPVAPIVGEVPSLTAQQVAREAETRFSDLRRLWRALGFADAGGEAAFAAADVEAVRLIQSLVGGVDGDEDATLSLTRALGTTMARLADWQVSTIAAYTERAYADDDLTHRLARARQLVQEINERFERLLVYAWRRHLAAAASRLEPIESADDPHSVHATVAFVDLVGFTELSNGMREDELADMVERFETTCGDVIASRHGRVVKTLGDSVLFWVMTPVDAVDVATTIVERIRGDSTLPDVHVGMATGPIVLRLGDVFGPPVNMASRLTGLAQRNRVLCDSATADAVADHPGVSVRAMTRRQVRGFGSVEPFTVRWRR